MQDTILALLMWSYCFTLLFFVFYISILKNHDPSVLITSCIVLCFNSLMLIIENPIQHIEDIDLYRFLWYNSFAVCTIFVIFFIRVAHLHKKIPLSLYAKLIMRNYSVLGFIQFIGYWDQLTFNSAFVDSFYRIGVPSIGLAISIIFLGALLKDSVIQIIRSEQLKSE